VVDRGPLDARGADGADWFWLCVDAGGIAGGGGTYRCFITPYVFPEAGFLSGARGGGDGGGFAAFTTRRSALCLAWLRRGFGVDRGNFGGGR